MAKAYGREYFYRLDAGDADYRLIAHAEFTPAGTQQFQNTLGTAELLAIDESWTLPDLSFTAANQYWSMIAGSRFTQTSPCTLTFRA